MHKSILNVLAFLTAVGLTSGSFAQTPQDIVNRFSTKNSADKAETCENFRPIFSRVPYGPISEVSGPALIKQLKEKADIYTYFISSCQDYSPVSDMVDKLCKPSNTKVLSQNLEVLCNLQRTGIKSNFDNTFKLAAATYYLKLQADAPGLIANNAKTQALNLDKLLFTTNDGAPNYLTFEKIQKDQYRFVFNTPSVSITGLLSGQELMVEAPKELASCKIAYEITPGLEFSTKQLASSAACSVLVPDRGWKTLNKLCAKDTEKSFISNIFQMWDSQEFAKANYAIQDKLNACADVAESYQVRLLILKDAANISLGNKSAGLCNKNNNFEYPQESYLGKTLKANPSLIDGSAPPDFWKNVKKFADAMCVK